MTPNKKKTAEIMSAYANYGDNPDKWPDKVKGKIRGQTEEEHTAENKVLRNMICRGYTNEYIAQERSKTPQYLQQLRKKMRKRRELDYQATPDELLQLKYNVSHMNKPNSQGIGRVMERDEDWVSCMQEKFLETQHGKQ